MDNRLVLSKKIRRPNPSTFEMLKVSITVDCNNKYKYANANDSAFINVT
jgi:hypothetical protein